MTASSNVFLSNYLRSLSTIQNFDSVLHVVLILPCGISINYKYYSIIFLSYLFTRLIKSLTKRSLIKWENLYLVCVALVSSFLFMIDVLYVSDWKKHTRMKLKQNT